MVMTSLYKIPHSFYIDPDPALEMNQNPEPDLIQSAWNVFSLCWKENETKLLSIRDKTKINYLK
jgi:hypothetical protein